MCRFLHIYLLLLLLFVLQLAGCGAARSYSNPGYRQLLMYSRTPKEVYGYKCEGGFLQFQNFEQVTKDTIAILKFDQDDRFEFYGGISVGEDYERFENIKIIEYKGDAFFVVTARNSGNSNGNMLHMYYIDRNNCSLHPVEIVYALESYSKTLPEDLLIWNDETINYDDNSIISDFYLWERADIHSRPSGGKVSAIYDLEMLAEGKYRLYPKEYVWTEGVSELD